MCVTYLCCSSLASAGPAVREPPGAAGAEGQPEGGAEGEGAAPDGEAGQCRRGATRTSGTSGIGWDCATPELSNFGT